MPPFVVAGRCLIITNVIPAICMVLLAKVHKDLRANTNVERKFSTRGFVINAATLRALVWAAALVQSKI